MSTSESTEKSQVDIVAVELTQCSLGDIRNGCTVLEVKGRMVTDGGGGGIK